MVFDCASEVDGGAVWMRDNHIVGEVGWGFWQRHPELVHGWGEVEYR